MANSKPKKKDENVTIEGVSVSQSVIDTFSSRLKSQEAATKLIKQFLNQGKSIYSEKDTTVLNKYLLQRIQAYFSQPNSGKEWRVQCIPITASKTDFGASNVKQKALEAMKKDKDEAIAKGLVNENLQPLYQSGFNKGKPITDIEFTKMWDCFVRESENEDWKIIQVNAKKKWFSECVPLFNLYNVNLFVNPKKDGGANYNATDNSNFEKVSALSYDESKQLLERYIPERVTTLKDVEKWIEVNPKDSIKPYFCVVYANLAPNGLIAPQGRVKNWGMNLVPDLSDAEMLEMIGDEETSFKQIMCWSQDTPELLGTNMRIREGAVGMIVIARPSVTNNPQFGNQIMLNLNGLWVDERFVEREQAQPIGPEQENKSVSKEPEINADDFV